MRGVSGFLHPHDEICRQSQALCAPPSRKLRGVSGCLHPHHKIADSFRLWARSVLCVRQNWGTSQALCTPMMKLPTGSGSEHFLRTPLTKAGGRLRLCAPPMMKIANVKIANSLRLRALFVHSIHENCGASQAFCTPMMKLADMLRLCAPSHEVWRLRLCAPP